MSSALPCGQAVDDVEERDIAQPAQKAQVGTGGADVAGADKGDFSTLDHTLPEGPTPLSSMRLTYISAIAARAKLYQPARRESEPPVSRR